MTKRLPWPGDVLDRAGLLAVRAGGSLQRRITRGTGRFASTLAAVSLVLLLLPALLNLALGLVPDSVWEALQAATARSAGCGARRTRSSPGRR